MKTLDLHGVSHRDADRLVENFVLLGETPLRIVTGDSPAMREIVSAVLGRHGFCGDYESHWNLGSIIVKESMR